MSPISRGFQGRHRQVDAARLTPGQYLEHDFPVLSAGPTPRTPLDAWTFVVRGAVDEPVSLTWHELLALPAETPTVDIHCVTKWSKFDTTWKGVSVDTLLAELDTEAEYVTAWCDGGYTTNLPLDDVTGGQAWIAYEFEGEPLDPEHGGPARLLVPHLYFWKSAKWVRGLELLNHDQPGFWEGFGYHNHGDPGRSSAMRGTEHTQAVNRAHRDGSPPASGTSAATGDRARAVFGQVMGLVALTVGCVALGAYISRDLTGGAGIAFFVGALVCIVGLNLASARGREHLATTLLFGLGLLLGLAVGPVINAYAKADPAALWQAAGATGAFVATLGAVGYATRRDLSSWARTLFWALIALIVFGIVAIFVAIPNANLIYAIAGLVIFGGFTIFDFNRLRRAGGESAVPIAASIFLDIFNVFLFMLQLFGGNRD